VVGGHGMNHKHYVFQLLDRTPKKNLPIGGPFVLGMYLKAKMYYYAAENRMSLKGDEQQYINMLSEEYAVDGVSSD
jgi:hypothetical protein